MNDVGTVEVVLSRRQVAGINNALNNLLGYPFRPKPGLPPELEVRADEILGTIAKFLSESFGQRYEGRRREASDFDVSARDDGNLRVLLLPTDCMLISFCLDYTRANIDEWEYETVHGINKTEVPAILRTLLIDYNAH